MSVVQHLWRYLQDHPDACDTCEGIARWWLDTDPAAPVSVVEEALAWMAAQGLVEALHAADGHTLYRGVKGPATQNALLGPLPAVAPPSPGPKRPPRSIH